MGRDLFCSNTMSITETQRDSVISMRLRDVALSMHSAALYLRLFNPWPTLPKDWWWCTLFFDIFGILFLFWSILRDPGPSPGSKPYQHQALRGSLRFNHLRDLSLHKQLVALAIRIFYSDALALFPEIFGLQLLFWCFLRDGDTRAELPQVHPDANQFGYEPIPTSDDEFVFINKEVESEDIVAQALKDANQELFAEVMQFDGIEPHIKLRVFDYIVANDMGNAFLAIPPRERKDWLLMKKISDSSWWTLILVFLEL